MHKKPNDIYKNFTKFKDVNPRTKENEDLKANVLDNVGDLLNDSYYIYKERYEEEKNTLSKKDTQKIDNTKWRLADDHLYESEEEDKQTDKQIDKQTDKKPDKKEPPKKQNIDVKNLYELINKEEMGINRESFKRYFNFQRPSEMLKFVYITNDK